MKKIVAKYKKQYSSKSVLVSSIAGVSFFLVSLVVNYFASQYATRNAGGATPDIILSNVPTFNVDFIVNEVAFVFFLFSLVVVILEPKKIPFGFKSVALLVIIRSMFIMLTHLGPYADKSYIDATSLFGPFNLGSDFFFSGHTALPFLVALIFWDNKFVRNVSIGASLLFGVSVLLGHLHYSIDVFGAFFITYSIFALAKKLFASDYEASNK